MVERLEGSEEAKRRLRVILETVAGQREVADACEELGIGKTAFFELRKRVLQTSLADLEAKPVGRPARQVSPEDTEVERLMEENERLRTDLEISQVREEIALSMPEVFLPSSSPSEPKKKLPPSKTSRKREQQRKQQRKSRKRKKGW